MHIDKLYFKETFFLHVIKSFASTFLANKIVFTVAISLALKPNQLVFHLEILAAVNVCSRDFLIAFSN